VTQLLADLSRGDRAALTSLVPLVYEELRRLAGRALRGERVDHTLQATALVHEAFLRLFEQRSVQWRDRRHFLNVAAQMMRRVLVDHARRRLTTKRGGEAERQVLDEALLYVEQRGIDLLALDEALCELSEIDPRQGRIVELRFFGGLTLEETAEAVGTSLATVKREWALARSWLYRRIMTQRKD
jgi:RNA polymerase sigma factor (TIGR02999 family)